MDSNLLLTIVIALLPGVLVAVVVYFVIEKFLKNETLRREIEVRRINTDQVGPQRFAAYERMALFLERIKPTALVRRISAQSTAKNYEILIVQAIQSEWEHNLSQQIYVNPETWKIIYSAKNATQNFIRECVMEMDPEATAQQLQEHIIQKSINENVPSNGALLKLQVDIQGAM